jgi:hypothetical protein
MPQIVAGQFSDRFHDQISDPDPCFETIERRGNAVFLGTGLHDDPDSRNLADAHAFRQWKPTVSGTHRGMDFPTSQIFLINRPKPEFIHGFFPFLFLYAVSHSINENCGIQGE